MGPEIKTNKAPVAQIRRDLRKLVSPTIPCLSPFLQLRQVLRVRHALQRTPKRWYKDQVARLGTLIEFRPESELLRLDYVQQAPLGLVLSAKHIVVTSITVNEEFRLFSANRAVVFLG